MNLDELCAKKIMYIRVLCLKINCDIIANYYCHYYSETEATRQIQQDDNCCRNTSMCLSISACECVFNLFIKRMHVPFISRSYAK